MEEPPLPSTSQALQSEEIKCMRGRLLLVLCLSLLDAFLGLWRWKIQSFPSLHWYQQLAEFLAEVGAKIGIATASGAGLIAVVNLLHALWKRTPPKATRDITLLVFNRIPPIIEQPVRFRAALFALITVGVVLSAALARIPPSKETRLALKSQSYDLTKPLGLVLSPDGKEVYIADEGASRLLVFKTNPLSLRHQVPLSNKPWGIAVTPNGTEIFITSVESGMVEVIDSSSYKTIAKIRCGPKPYWITITPDGTKAYVSNEGGVSNLTPEGPVYEGNISVIDVAGHKLINTILGVNLPEGLDVARDTKLLYVATQGGWTDGHWGEDPVFVVDTETDRLLTNQRIDGMAVGVTLAVKPDGTKVYVARGNLTWPGPFEWWDLFHKNRTPLGVIDTTFVGRAVIKTNIILKTSVSSLAITPDGKYVLVGNGNEIAFVETSNDQVINRIKLSSTPHGLAIGTDGWVYVTLPEEGMLFAFSLIGRT